MNLDASVILAAALAAASILLIFTAVATAPRTAPVDVLAERLRQFAESGRAPTSLAEVEMSLPFVERVIRPLLNRVGHRLTARTPAARQQALADKIALAGRPLGLTVGGFLALRLFAMLILAVLGYGAVVLLNVGGTTQIAGPAVGGVLGYLLPQSMLSRRIRKRQKEVLLALPSALDLLTISVEAGLGFDAALARVTDKYRNALASEFALTLNEMRLGRPRVEALEDLGRRNGVEELNNFVQAVIQSEQLGVGIAGVLRIQSEEIRRRRRVRAEEQGAKAPLKMLFPMVGCIFPTLFVVLLGPGALLVAHTFLNK